MSRAAEEARAVRGAVYLIHHFRFPNDPEAHAKFFVLMEGYHPAKRSIVVAFGTSNTDYHFMRSTVLVERGVAGLPDPTLFQLDNWTEIPARHLLGGRCRYIGQLPPDIIRQLDDALQTLSREMDKAIWLRMCG